jgi:YbbR domain-containing protein
LSGQESYELKLDLPNGITLHDPTTNVKLNYDFALDIKKNLTLPASSFQIKNADENLNYKINTKIDHIALTLFGESKLLEDKNETNVFAYINVENLKPGDYVYDLMFENVDNLTVVESNPSEISFTITNKNMENLDEE